MKDMKLVYTAIFEPFDNTIDGYTVSFPDLPGCNTEGDNLCEAMEMAVDAASGWLLGELEEGNQIPKATAISDISTLPNQIKTLVYLDIGAYAAKYGKNAVKKTLTIPAWMNTYAEAHDVSCSKLLQDAIKNLAAASN